MPNHEPISVEGRIGDIFVHRFIIETARGKILADLGPKCAQTFRLETGLDIVAEGEMKPSELKIERIARKGDQMLEIEHRKKHSHGPDHHLHEHAEPNDAKRAVARAGFEPIGEPRRKPRHFEVLARKDMRLVECHVAFDGHIRKERPIDMNDHKWSRDIEHAA